MNAGRGLGACIPQASPQGGTQDRSMAHQLSNPDPEQRTVSLHIYSPPYSACNCFEPATGRRKLSTV